MLIKIIKSVTKTSKLSPISVANIVFTRLIKTKINFIIFSGLLPLTISISAPIGLYVTVHASYLIWRTKNKIKPKLNRTQIAKNDTQHEMNSITPPSGEIVSTRNKSEQKEDIEEIDEMN